MENQGDGTLFDSGLGVAVGLDPGGIAVSDLDGDAHLDVVTANQGSASVSVLYGTGFGTFSQRLDVVTGNRCRRVAITDVINDGVLDIVAANQGASSVSTLLGNGGRQFQDRIDTQVTNSSSKDVAVGDFDEDGNVDLAVASGFNFVAVFRGDGVGHFGSRVDYDCGLTVDNVGVADLNRDGHMDFAGAGVLSDDVRVWFGAGPSLSFPTTQVLPLGGKPIHLLLADLTGDGLPELAAVNSRSQSLSLYINETLSPTPVRDLAVKVTFNTGRNWISWSVPENLHGAHFQVFRDLADSKQMVCEKSGVEGSRLTCIDDSGVAESQYWIEVVLRTGAVEEYGPFTSSRSVLESRLGQPFPNPFTSATTFHFDLVAPSSVQIQVVDVLGRVVANLAAGHLVPGQYSLSWDGRTLDGSQAPAGIYLLRAILEGTTSTMKMLKYR